jgi:hypothetical protein
VAVSLWDVCDEESRRLAVGFHRRCELERDLAPRSGRPSIFFSPFRLVRSVESEAMYRGRTRGVGR